MDIGRLEVLVRQLQAALGGNRVLRGTVSSAGAVLRGTGFTASQTGVGAYTVAFDRPFATVPSVTTTPEGAGATGARPSSVSTSACTVDVFTSSTGANLDMRFSFVAVG